METKDRVTLAALLRQAALQTIAEEQFWAEAKDLTDRLDEPMLKLAVHSASSYWALFHHPKKFLLRAPKPDPAELRQARDELNLIAAVLETGWQLPVLVDTNQDN